MLQGSAPQTWPVPKLPEMVTAHGADIGETAHWQGKGVAIVLGKRSFDEFGSFIWESIYLQYGLIQL